MGVLLFEHRERVEHFNISKSILIAGIVLFETIAVIEGYVFPIAQFYIGNIATCMLIMLLGIKYPGMKIQPFWYIGTKLSTLVYIYHVAVIHILNKIYANTGVSDNLLCSYFQPVFVVLLTLLISWSHMTLKKNIRVIS